MTTAAPSPVVNHGNQDIPGEFTELIIDELDPHARKFNCPHCHTLLQFKLAVRVTGVSEIKETDDGKILALVPRPTAPRPTIDPLSTTERRVVDRMKQNGTLAAFEKAVVASGRNVKNIQRYFLTFLYRATQVRYAEAAIRRCLPTPPPTNTTLELWQLDSTCAVTANGQLRAFIPIQLVKGQSAKSLTSKNGTIGSEETNLAQWIRTRHGYVASPGPMMSELQKQARGNFDSLNLSSSSS